MKLIATVGHATREKYRYSDPRLERRGYLGVYSYAVEGLRHRQELVERGSAALVLPIDEKNRELYMIRQPRWLRPLSESVTGRIFLGHSEGPIRVEAGLDVPSDDVLVYECAAGMIDAGETPLEAAVRELREETGLIAPPADFELVADRRYTSIGFTTERISLYFAHLRGPHVLTPPQGDGDEQITVWKMSWKEAFDLLDQGKVDSLPSAQLLLALKIRMLELHLRRID
jgi:8-oxo-dGTP pyrophosphatase MutT (NUDIX family)